MHVYLTATRSNNSSDIKYYQQNIKLLGTTTKQNSIVTYHATTNKVTADLQDVAAV